MSVFGNFPSPLGMGLRRLADGKMRPVRESAAATPAVVPQVKTAASEYPSRMSDDEKSLHSFLFLSDVQQPFPFFLPLRFAPRLSLAFLFFRWTTVAL